MASPGSGSLKASFTAVAMPTDHPLVQVLAATVGEVCA